MPGQGQQVVSLIQVRYPLWQPAGIRISQNDNMSNGCTRIVELFVHLEFVFRPASSWRKEVTAIPNEIYAMM